MHSVYGKCRSIQSDHPCCIRMNDILLTTEWTHENIEISLEATGGNVSKLDDMHSYVYGVCE